MRVLAVGNMYPPHHLGGYELVWRSAMRHLRARGHIARVLDDGLSQRHRHWRARRARHVPGAAVVLARPHLAADRLARAGRARAPQRGRARSTPAGAAPGRGQLVGDGGDVAGADRAVRRARLPAVAFVADDWLVYGPRVDRWTRAFRGWGRAGLAPLAERATGLPARVDFDAAARYVLISETVRDRARASGLELPGSEIAHLGVDPDFLRPRTRMRPPRPWGWRLLYVGRIDERKGIRDAVDALAQLPSEATLTVVGDGDPGEVERVRAAARGLGVAERVVLLGMRSHAQLPALYEAADAVLFPVRWLEPRGIVPLEAMVLGRP